MIERAEEVRRISRAMEAGRAGIGRAVLIEGVPGIGKSALIEAACRQAEAVDLKVLTACGGRLERDFPFGVARQLLEPVVHPPDGFDPPGVLSGPARLAGGLLDATDSEGNGMDSTLPAGPAGAVVAVHALWWVLVNLARLQPVAIIVDDAHWSDVPSLRLLTYAARRITEAPVVLVVGTRSTTQPDVEPLSTALLDTTEATLLRPAALTLAGGAQLVRRFVPAARDEFCRACHDATGGNPFLLSELARDIENRASGDLAVPERLSAAVLARIDQAPPGSLSLARAVSVLGRTVRLRHAAVVAGLDVEAAGIAADALAAAAVLRAGRPLEFRHPILATAVAASIPPRELSAAHVRAARLLADEDGASERIGAHLLAAEPCGDAWSCVQLRVAGRDATARGAPDVAVRYLRRALEEPPADEVRAEVLLELGAAEALNTDFEPAIDHLHRGIERLTDPQARLGSSLLLAGVLLHCGRFDDLVSTLEPALQACEPSTSLLVARAEADLVNATLGRAGPRRLMAGRIEQLVRRVRSGEATAPPTLAAAAAELVVTGADASDAADLAESALAAVHTDRDRYESWPHVALRCMAIAGRPVLARRAVDFKINRAREQGSLQELRALLPLRAEVAMRSGDLGQAEVDVREAIGMVDEAAWPTGFSFAIALLIVILVERDERAAAAALVEDHVSDQLLTESTELYSDHYLLNSRGRFSLACGDVQAGTADLLEVGRRQDAAGESNPAVIDWRSQAALGLLHLGDKAGAENLASQELALAQRFGAPGPIGVAERAIGLVEGGDRGVEWLQRAASTLEFSSARLEHARVLVDLGAALRRAGHRDRASRSLRDGSALAEQCGATALQHRAMTELRAAGARPRRTSLTGPQALTTSELRVAELAAAERSNAHIAATLHISIRTVEYHLTGAYRKLGIHSRRELSEALDRDGGNMRRTNEYGRHHEFSLAVRPNVRYGFNDRVIDQLDHSANQDPGSRT